MYSPAPTPLYEKKIRKLFKRDRPQAIRVSDKMKEILENPHCYKHLRNILKGIERVQVGSFVITFSVDDSQNIVKFLDYDHHDKIYRN